MTFNSNNKEINVQMLICLNLLVIIVITPSIIIVIDGVSWVAVTNTMFCHYILSVHQNIISLLIIDHKRHKSTFITSMPYVRHDFWITGNSNICSTAC